MKICIISDTHNKHKYLKNLPEADVIVHCGDITSVGRNHEVANFMDWFSALDKFKHKIFIAGNHDFLFERESIYAKTLVPDNVIYLEDNGVEIDEIRFWGSPVSKPFNNWAFNRPEEKLLQHWQVVPADTDVLITHTPPYSIMDWVDWNRSHEGSPTLYKEVVERIKPKIHCFGNIHGGYGMKTLDGITFVNASNLDEDYVCVNAPIVLEIMLGDVYFDGKMVI
ncbi:MAG: metallophosphatase domain-containing protein [Dehalococcoidia bacterium]